MNPLSYAKIEDPDENQRRIGIDGSQINSKTNMQQMLLDQDLPLQQL